MKRIVFWTSAKPATIKATIGKTLQRMETTPLHKFVPIGDERYVPASDELVLATGKTAVELLAQAGVVPKGRAIEGLRGKTWQKPNEGVYMVGYDPGLVEREPGLESDVIWDVQLIARMYLTGSLEAKLGEYRWVSDFSELINCIKARYILTGESTAIAFDIETLRRSPFEHGSRIVAMGFTDRVGNADLLYVPDLRTQEHALLVHSQVKWLLTSPMVKLRGANLKFDLNWLLVKWQIACTNFAMDTLLVGSILDENRSNGLKNHVKIYCTELGGYDDALEKGEIEAMHLISKEKMRKYLGGDVDGTLRVSIAMLAELQPQPTLKRFYTRLLHPGSIGFQRIEREGICVSIPRFKQLQIDLEAEIKKLSAQGLSLLPARLRYKYCIAEGQMVLTDNGLKTIETVSISDKVWDGIEWVSHDGVVFQGWKEVIEYDGLIATPDHLVYTETGEKARLDCVSASGRQLAVGEAEGSAIRFLGGDRRQDRAPGGEKSSISLLQVLEHRKERSCIDKPVGDRQFERSCRASEEIRSKPSDPRPAISSLRSYGGSLFQPQESSVQGLRRPWNREQILVSGAFYQVGAQGVASSGLSQSSLGSYEQRRTLRAGQFAAVDPPGEPAPHDEDDDSTVRGEGMGPARTSRPSIEECGEVRFDGGPVPPPRETRKIRRANPVRVYDIINAGPRHRFTVSGKVVSNCDNLSLSRAALLKDYFFTPMGLNLKPKLVTEKTKEPSTAKNHLEMFFDVPEAKAMCEVLDGLGGATKTLSTYAIGFLKHLRADGRLHPTYFLHSGGNDWGDDDGGTVTGRLSAKDPAVQTIPKKTKWGKRIRECFIAPPGYVCLEVDYSQGELRLTACIADEPNMIAAYKAGIDLHCKTGASLAGMSLEEFMALEAIDPDKFGYLRGKAKPANFGIIYGISWEGYKTYAWNGYRVSMTDQEAMGTVDGFFVTYPELPNWHKRYRAMAHRDGFVTSPLGRVRHLPHIHAWDSFTRSKAERQAVNSPVQATLSDMMVYATAEVNDNYPEYIPFAMIHDADYFYVLEDKAQEAAKNVTAIMSNLPLRQVFGWDHQLDFPADATVGPDLGHMVKVKLAA